MLVEIILSVVLLGGLAWWLRGFFRPAQRAFRQAKALMQTAQSIRETFKDVQARVSSQATTPHFKPSDRVVDVTARVELGVLCPVCRDKLNAAQLRALRECNVRCPGSVRVGLDCPYYGMRDLN